MTAEERLKHQTILQQCCDEWKKLLVLNEWDINVHIYDAKDETLYNTTRAKIVRNTGQAYFPFPDTQLHPILFSYDEEVELVLHLLQIRFEMINNENGANEIYYQRALYVLAQTLVKLKNDADKYSAMIQDFESMYQYEVEDKETEQKPISQPVKIETGIRKLQPVNKKTANKRGPKLIN